MAKRGERFYTRAMKRVLGVSLLTVAAVCLGAAVSLAFDAVAGKDASDSIGGAVVLAALAAASIWGASRSLARRRPARPSLTREEKERLVLERARAGGGKLTQAELALDGGLSIDEAGKLLDELTAKGIAAIEVSASGAVVYDFPGIIPAGEKAAAKDVGEA